MSINKKLIYKTLLTISGVIILAAGGLMAYLAIPSGFQSRQAEGPKVLTELLNMAEKSQPFNPDPYISSTYRPGDPLYEPLLYIQRHRQGKAEELLKPLVEQGNPDAMYWLAQITYDDSYYSSGPAAKLFQKSAELGNPYAALRLDINDRECQMFMGGYCDKKWGELGRKLLQERAEQGDKKAAYYLLQYDENSSEEVHKKLEKLVTENAKNHYYQPLMRLMKSYKDRMYLTFFNRRETISSEENKYISELAFLPVNNNFPPAMTNIVFFNRNFYKKPYLLKVIKQSIMINTEPFLCIRYYTEVDNIDRNHIIDSAACAIASDQLENRDDNLRRFNYILKENNLNPLTKLEFNNSHNKAQEIINNMTPVIYIDEMNPKP
ncbi:tetratricopeptide repeat protein [Vibrio gazogenes]|uniref:Sel1 repeat-containing protein n=1 Tax=Vibrio gazogenes DSM 21264 = NBRC 103151 TaxID=1123492 RepID=A0A1M5BX84_VIBGA|nr:sel1 repeat family protein [Vibrio gazogenes]USP13613.1 sel1 repeat family protein [Vibrio gazogenes]SHF47134.1 hypothetical protein SAMN02745781_02390 [Vibrio gazogenes DSM 21264] [Vibrio gazogenes DSM 21264 = NBRC 103151]SJN55655.1 hypothetical protein BQ6471_01653 [Vibrio gazogenes]